MFRAKIRWLANGPILNMEGTLVRDWAEQARSLITKDVVPKGLIVDLTGLSYIDSSGEQLLKWLGDVGAEFVAGNFYVRDVCKRLNLLILKRVPARPKQRCESAWEKIPYYRHTCGLKPVPAHRRRETDDVHVT